MAKKTFNVGDKVRLKTSYTWHYGEVKAIEDGRCLVWWTPARWHNTPQTWVSNTRLWSAK